MADPPICDPFAALRAATSARIGLGRAGQGLPTAAMLAFQRDHALACDAVHAVLDVEALIAGLGEDTMVVDSAATDRATYLRRPDLGRRLAGDVTLESGDPVDLAIVVVDGLSATAINVNAVPLVAALRPLLTGWRIAPVMLVRQGRVAIGDPIGAALRTSAVLVLIGERPGLAAADGIGAYLTWDPAPGRRDSERNCVSNIRDGGLAPAMAARSIAWLLAEARRLQQTGVALKNRFDGQAALDDGS
ncbi:ethanolamine ammonia-lyase light chain [Sphingomonas sp. PP-F2F-A104-K0414]|uniref:ethanolamine ammonia-lyase subunit EutC n=1 Tax=Sphingomonas sp. PP-F2F-A104-K0414 TaxID=2135661 RepID=UPI001049B539|nr:ethanolamine ammonia-lyase subunit EutC [Sphingomonas sp. PP-F2F-A104-K0414]TCP96752.1 ethanolamine ammonia-lyase light chain [Sphingomonas sp. PP-F2F-A104-K0414]